MDKKVVSDDALISTDIDSLIRHLAAKKRTDMGSLARELNMTIPIVKKWVSILEEEGYVKIEYSLLSEIVIWAGADVRRPPEEKEQQLPFDSLQSAGKSEPQPYQNQRKLPQSSAEQPKQEFTTEERVGKILERLGEGQSAEKKSEEITKSILSSFEAEQEEKTGKQETGEKSAGAFENEFKKDRILEKFEDKPNRAEKARREEEKSQIAAQTASDKEQERSVLALKRSLAGYMEEIRRQKAEVEHLKGEKAKLLAEVYSPIEKKFSIDYESIADRILEKEGSIIELKERLVAIPPKVGEMEKVKVALRAVMEGARHSLSESREKYQEIKKSQREEEAKAALTIKEMEKTIKEGRDEVGFILKSVSVLDLQEKEAKASMETLRSMLAEINKGMEVSVSAISHASEKRSELVSRIEGVKSLMDSRSKEVEQSYSRLKEVRKAEEELETYLSDYHGRIKDIEEYVKEGEKEMSRLREFAEVKYMRNYMKELQSLAASYETELEMAEGKEKDVDASIDAAKARLEELFKESRSLVKSLEQKTSGRDFDSLLSEIKGRHAGAVSALKKGESQPSAPEGQISAEEAEKPKSEPAKFVKPLRKKPAQKSKAPKAKSKKKPGRR